MLITFFIALALYFPKAISQVEFVMLVIKLPRIIVVRDFSSSSFKLKRAILPTLTKYYPILKTA